MYLVTLFKPLGSFGLFSRDYVFGFFSLNMRCNPQDPKVTNTIIIDIERFLKFEFSCDQIPRGHCSLEKSLADCFGFIRRQPTFSHLNCKFQGEKRKKEKKARA